MWIVPPLPGMIEPAVTPEFYVSEIGAIELVDRGCVRVYYCAEQLPLESGLGEPQYVVLFKTVRPICRVASALGRFAQVLSTPPPTGVQPRGPWEPRLVR